MNTRRWILLGLILLLVFGLGNFAINTVQTRSQLGDVASTDAAKQDNGIRALMARNLLFDSLQGGAPPATRLNAIASLERMAKGGQNIPAFKELLQMLKDPDTESAEAKTHPVRDAAKDAVARIGTAYSDLLLDAAKDADGNIRDQSRAALKQIGAPLQGKMAAKLGDAALRAPLGDILSGIGPTTIPLIAPYLQPPLLDLKAKSDDLAKAKLELIEIMGKFKTADAATPLLPYASDPDPNVRRSVITSLANIADPVGAPILINALTDEATDASARAAAAGALGAIATPAANTAMAKALSDYDTAVASSAAAGLRRAGDKAATAIAQSLSDKSATVRTYAATATGGMTSPALAIRALSDADVAVRGEAALSLGDVLTNARMKKQPIPPAALLPLITALKDKEELVAANASLSLSRLGTTAVPSLAALLASPDETLAYRAGDALRAIGKPAVDSLLPLAENGKPTARWAAVTLGQIGDIRAESVLEILSKSADADTAAAAANALAKVKAG